MSTATGWTVHLDLSGVLTDSDLDELLDALAAYAPAATAVVDGRLGITMSIDTPEDPIHAAMKALDAVTDAGAGFMITLEGLEVWSYEEHDRRLAEPAYPELVGITEIANMLGVTRQRASALQTRPGFPQPLQVLASGPVWPRTWISRFAETWERKGGRPPKQLPPTSTYMFDPSTDRTMAAVRKGDVLTLREGERVRVVDVKPSATLTTLHLEEVGDDVEETVRPT